MRMTTFRGEASIDDLAARVYSGLDEAKRERARVALLEANPRLADPSSLATGAPVVVPKVRGLKLKSRSRSAPADPMDGARKAAEQGLEAYAAHLEARHRTHQTRLAEQIQLLADKQLKRALGASPEAKERAKQLETELKKRTAEAGRAQREVHERLDQLGKSLGAL